MTVDKSIIKDALLFICMNTQPKQGPTVRFWSRNNISFLLNEQEESRFAEAVREILKDRMVSENWTIREIEGEVEDIISRTSQVPIAQRQTNIVSEIDNFFKSITKEIREYQFVVPIFNLKIHKPLQIGDVRFKFFSSYQVKKWLKMFREVIESVPKYNAQKKKESIKLIMQENIEPLRNKVCAETIVKARIERAREIALRKIAQAVDILKLYCLVVERGPYGSNVGLVGETLGSSVRAMLVRSISDANLHPALERVGSLYGLEIDSKLLKMMRKIGIRKVNKMLLAKKRTWVENKVLRAIYWYSRIFDTPLRRVDEEKILLKKKKHKRRKRSSKREEIVEYGHLNDRLVKSMLAFESLLIIDKHESIQNNIAERSAYILRKGYTKRKDLKNFIKDMYDLRSDVVHRGFTYVSVGELSQFISYVREAIITIILKKDRLGLRTQQDFYEWFEKKKFS